MKIASALITVLAAVSRWVSASTVTIPADADTTLHETTPANNFGARASLQAGVSGGAGTRARTLLSFNVGAAIPPGATILAARLNLTATDASAVSQAFEVRRVSRPWSEGAQASAAGGPAATNDATWTHRLYPNVGWSTPGGAPGADVAATASAEFAVGNAGAHRIESTAQLTADVQAWLDTPESNYGWMLLGKNEAALLSARNFAAREDSARAPSLQVDFTTDTPGFNVTSIVRANGQATLNWTGGRTPFQVFTRPDLLPGAWTPIGAPVATNSATVSAAAAQGFFRVVSEPTAEYDVVFNTTWTAATHPADFPAGAHWSGLVGGLHDNRVEFWRPGATASEGMRIMAELGGKSTLLAEVNAAITAGTANRTLSGAGISGGAGTATLRFQIDRSHPLVTLVSMIAPSPDWFAGVRGLPLIENGQWVQSKTVALIPWDTGTDSGLTFTSANEVTVPRGVITRIVTPPLATNGIAPPMGTFTFTLVRIIPAP